ncbi:GNAT family N-acetyltransferase [Poseidonocella sedimentorum]|uniref:Putative acetyltransferase n=1 Tax=Poseidonocella sedimentorum TaxID=871652 RepID=A0A1I6E112_9RHOB|nr:GNAT family N-acetyltransferase [Poseidonocella sedimentorum]SFR11386.1 putative acetyltransferase [Poseidonocella sedimentorum]
MSPVVAQSDPRDPDASALLRASHALMMRLFSPEENHFLSVDALGAPNIRFVTARVGGRVMGCGALKICDGYGELKSMFTAPEARGKGVAAAVLTHLEAEARKEGLPVIRLETGDLLHDAHRLYARHGFSVCDAFGDYEETPSSIFMEKLL